MSTESEVKAYAEGLHRLADWIAANPEVGELPQCGLTIYGLNEKEEAARLIRALGKCTKRYGDEMFYVEKTFGPITLSAVFYRDKVCTRKVVGTQTIPEHVIPAKVVPEETRELVEWECEPIMAPSDSRVEIVREHEMDVL